LRECRGAWRGALGAGGGRVMAMAETTHREGNRMIMIETLALLLAVDGDWDLMKMEDRRNGMGVYKITI